HRKQFVLGPEYFGGFPRWRRSEVTGGLRLTSHPDLGVTNAEHSGVALTLLGYLLDPATPTATDAEILTRLATGVAGGDDLFRALEPYGGRYLLIADLGAGTPLLVGDPVGTMQLFYSFAGADVWCAAQPHLLAEHLGLSDDPEALQFMS